MTTTRNEKIVSGRPKTRSSTPVKIPAGSKLKHGMLSTYTNLKCGCWRCTRANRENARQKRELIRAGKVHNCPECRCGAA